MTTPQPCPTTAWTDYLTTGDTSTTSAHAIINALKDDATAQSLRFSAKYLNAPSPTPIPEPHLSTLHIAATTHQWPTHPDTSRTTARHLASLTAKIKNPQDYAHLEPLLALLILDSGYPDQARKMAQELPQPDQRHVLNEINFHHPHN